MFRPTPTVQPAQHSFPKQKIQANTGHNDFHTLAKPLQPACPFENSNNSNSHVRNEAATAIAWDIVCSSISPLRYIYIYIYGSGTWSTRRLVSFTSRFYTSVDSRVSTPKKGQKVLF